MTATEDKKPVKRASSKSKQLIDRKSRPTAKPTKRTDVVRPKASAHAKRVAKGTATTRQASRPRKSQAGSVAGRHSATNGSSSSASYSARASQRKAAATGVSRENFVQRITSSPVALVMIIVVLVLVVVGVFDGISNWGKVYGNVSVNGMNVSGMTSDEVVDALKAEYGTRVSHAQVTIYANEEAQRTGGKAISDEELKATAEQVSVEEAKERVQSWDVDALTLKGAIPYDEIAKQALAVGRENGGIGKRFGLLVGREDIPVSVVFDDTRIEDLAGQIDSTVGDPRIDTTVTVVNGKAEPAEGHSGLLVDRTWLKGKLSDAMMSENSQSSFIAETVAAQSRISMQQANDMATAVNRAIEKGVTFKYQNESWTADPATLSNWTVVNIEGSDGDWRLVPTIDTSLAIPAVVSNAHAAITADDMSVRFEVSGSDVQVRTQGSGNIPEVSSAVDEMQDLLFGSNGIAWGAAPAETPVIQIKETDRPESLSFDDARNMGVITAIGEYTTEFSNYEGTENRNHNIKLVADIFNNGVVQANDGQWSFNDRSGNTNEEAGFWTAGSIVDGEYVDSVGGGICQVATTVFNAVLEAGLDVLERHNHTLYIASYPTGRDAAVDYPSDLDLVWKNNLKSEILVKTSYTDTSITVQLYSVRTGYEVEFDLGNWEEGEKYATLFEHDSSQTPGTYYRKTVGSNGSKISLTRHVTDEDGDAVKSDAFQSNYSAKDEVYVIGDNVDTSALVRSA